MGNLGSKKKQKADDETVTDDVWIKLNDGQQKSPKSKKKKKKKRKKKSKGDSPDREDGDASQCDSYSYSTLSSRRLSDSTIASTGTVTQQNSDKTSTVKHMPYYVDDQSNGSIGYVTASDTFATPPSPRKGHKAKFSPVIARDSPRVVRRLLQSEKIVEAKDEPKEYLSPRAKFFLTTPELISKNTGFENRKFNRHSSGSSIESKMQLRQADEKPSYEHSGEKIHHGNLGEKPKEVPVLNSRGSENSYITNGSLKLKSRQGNKSSCDSRISNNSLEMSDSTQENLIRTGEKAKWVRYDSDSLSPSQRRKFKYAESEPTDKNTGNQCFDQTSAYRAVPVVQSPSKTQIRFNDPELKKANKENLLNVNQTKEHVPPPSPASGITLSEVDESEATVSEASGSILTKEDELFGDSVCKRLSLLLETEHDSSKLERTEFHEFTDSHSSSPGIPQAPEEFCDEQYFDINPDTLNPVIHECPPPKQFQDATVKTVADEPFGNVNQIPIMVNRHDICSPVKTPQGKENASVLDVMNNNFRMKPVGEAFAAHAVPTNVDCANVMHKSTHEPNRNSQFDIEKQMINDNELNEKLIEEQIKMLNNIMPVQTDSSKRSSTLFAVNHKHANDPDNYILVTKKTYCVKRGILVELVDEEKDLIKRDVVKTFDAESDWIPIGSEEKYRPEYMAVEKGGSVSCPSLPVLEKNDLSESDTTESITSRSEPDLSRSEPDYVNLEDFERHEREFEREEQAFKRVCYELELERKESNVIKQHQDYDEIASTEEEIDYDNVLNRSQSQSDSDYSETRPKRESDILCDVIHSYKDDDYSDYSDSDGEILYADERNESGRTIGVLRTPSKLDQSLQKIFQEKAKLIAAAKEKDENKLEECSENRDSPVIEEFEKSHVNEVHSHFSELSQYQPEDNIDNTCNQASGYSPVDLNENMYENTQLVGYYSQKSSDSSRRSLAYTESDLDASEQWDDDDASNDSMLADDEDDDDDFCQIIYSKPYTPCVDHEQKVDAMFSFNMVKTLPDSPVVWEPEAEDDDVFQDDIPVGPSVYNPNDSFDLESSDEAFDDARKQMQEIHEQLQSLRDQMHTFDDGDDSSLPTSPSSPYDDRLPNIPKPAAQ